MPDGSHSSHRRKCLKKIADWCPVLGLTFAYLCWNSLFAKTQAKMVLKIEKKMKKIFFFEFFESFLKNLVKNINFKAQAGLESY